MYRISQFAKFVGIPMRTIHTWERRYGFFRAKRSKSGHRFYDENALAEARLIKSLSDEGVVLTQIQNHPQYMSFKEWQGIKKKKNIVRVKSDQDVLGMLNSINKDIKEIKTTLREEFCKLYADLKTDY